MKSIISDNEFELKLFTGRKCCFVTKVEKVHSLYDIGATAHYLVYTKESVSSLLSQFRKKIRRRSLFIRLIPFSDDYLDKEKDYYKEEETIIVGIVSDVKLVNWGKTIEFSVRFSRDFYKDSKYCKSVAIRLNSHSETLLHGKIGANVKVSNFLDVNSCRFSMN